MIYFDTCALLKLIRTDAQSEALSAFIDARPETRWFSSEVARTELVRTVRRINHDDRGRLIDDVRLNTELGYAERICAQIDLIAVSTRVLSEAAAIEQPFLRTLDAIHLAAATSLRSGLSAFVTYDKRLAGAAHELGLPALSPALRRTADGSGARCSGVQVAVDRFYLGGQAVCDAGAEVGLQHEAHPRCALGNRVDGGLDHRHGLVPVALDRGEHRVRPVGQPARANHPDRLGDDLADALAGAERSNRESDQHAPKASCPVPG